jgi:uncharacterized protein (DUF1697 family)
MGTGPVKFAAFFRNLNLGRPPAPTRTVLEAAFTEAGAVNPCSFLTNGTVVFEAGTPAKAARVLKAVQAALRRDGFDEPAALRDVDGLAALVASDPLAGVALDDVYDVPDRDAGGWRVPADDQPERRCARSELA